MIAEIVLAMAIQNAPVMTYTDQVRPIIKLRCFKCHGGKIPTLPDFSTYERAFKKRYQIRSRVWTLKSMPPGRNDMTDVERKMIKMWVDQGAKK